MASSNSIGRKQQPIDQGRKKRDDSTNRQNVNVNRNNLFADIGGHQRKSATTATSSSKNNNGRSSTSSSVISTHQKRPPSGRGRGGSRAQRGTGDCPSELKNGKQRRFLHLNQTPLTMLDCNHNRK